MARLGLAKSLRRVVSTLARAARRGDTANGKTVPLIVVVERIDVRAVEVEVAAVRGCIGGRRPVIAVAAHVVERAIVPVAAIHTF